jgi:hypothetical protein
MVVFNFCARVPIQLSKQILDDFVRGCKNLDEAPLETATATTILTHFYFQISNVSLLLCFN